MTRYCSNEKPHLFIVHSTKFRNVENFVQNMFLELQHLAVTNSPEEVVTKLVWKIAILKMERFKKGQFEKSWFPML